MTVTTLEKLPSVSAYAKPAILILGEVVRRSKLDQADLRILEDERLRERSGVSASRGYEEACHA
jgi:siroheme synthase